MRTSKFMSNYLCKVQTLNDKYLLSNRTGKPSTQPKFSAIRGHAITCTSNINIEYFKCIEFSSKEIDLRILESILIYKDKPLLNESKSAFLLSIF